MKNRRQFLAGSVGVMGVAGVLPVFTMTQEETKQQKQEKKSATKPTRPAPIAKELVGKFVGKSHGDIETVKEMLAKHPTLINSAWDWGNGDWETGLGAASHVGRRDIAELLLENGARVDAFAASMLGLSTVVEAMVKAMPNLHKVSGPHGICLLSHAIFGGEQADSVFNLLLTAGADVNARTISKSCPLIAAASAGRANIVEVLLSKGADPTFKNSKEQTALDIARKRKKTDVISILEKL